MPSNRRFPTDAEAEEFVRNRFGTEEQIIAAYGVGWVDQARAATEATQAIFEGLKSTGVMHGTTGQEPSREDLRNFARCWLAAESVGFTPICKHAIKEAALKQKSARPWHAVLDPIVVFCQACLPAVLHKITAMGHQYNNECDRCGAYAPMMYPFQMSIGMMTISGHLCTSCNYATRALTHPGSGKTE